MALVASKPRRGRIGSSSSPVFLLKRRVRGTLKGLNLGLSVLRVTMRLACAETYATRAPTL